jgi:hypothetical protein
MRRLAFQETRIRPRALVGAQPKPSAGAAPSEINHPAGTTRVQDANLFDTLTGGGHWLEVVRLVAPLELIKLVTCIVTGALRETAAGCPMGEAASTAKIRNAIDIRYSFHGTRPPVIGILAQTKVVLLARSPCYPWKRHTILPDLRRGAATKFTKRNSYDRSAGHPRR